MTTATQATTPAASGKIAVVREIPAVTTDTPATFMCVVDGITIGTSKHKDYFEFHKRRGDIVRLNDLEISKFIYVGADGNIAEQKKVEGAPAARGNVSKAIALAADPKPAPVGFNNQSHAQAQENGRKGAEARLKNAGVTGDRPNASGAADQSKPTASAGTQSTARAQTTGMKASVKNDKPSAKSDAKALTDEARQRAIENGKKGAARAAELRAQASSGSSTVSAKVPGKPGRPRKVSNDRAS
jgi:hypothetical protein